MYDNINLNALNCGIKHSKQQVLNVRNLLAIQGGFPAGLNRHFLVHSETLEVPYEGFCCRCV
jgi:hypothetical protein